MGRHVIFSLSFLMLLACSTREYREPNYKAMEDLQICRTTGAELKQLFGRADDSLNLGKIKKQVWEYEWREGQVVRNQFLVVYLSPRSSLLKYTVVSDPKNLEGEPPADHCR